MNNDFVIKALLLLNVFFVGQSFAALSAEEEQEIINGLMHSCRDKEKASDADMEILQRLGVPESREGRCVLACALETIGIFSKSKFQRKTFLFVSEIMSDKDPELIKVSIMIADECGSMEAERCELAAEFTRCSHRIFESTATAIGNKRVEIL